MTKRAYGLGLGFLAFMMFGNIVTAADFTLLNPSSYNVGDTIHENLVVKESTGGQKYITGKGTDRLGRIEFPVNLSGAFELIINADLEEDNGGQTITLISDETELRIAFWYYRHIGFASGTSHLGGWNTGTLINNMRLSISGTTAKLEINGQTHSEITLVKSGIIFTKLILGGIRENNDRLFDIKVKNSLSAPQPPAGAGNYILNASSYQAEDTIDENLKVKETPTGQKYITGASKEMLGRMELPVNLSGEFELIINSDLEEDNGGQTITLISDETELRIAFWYYRHIGFASGTSHLGGWNTGTLINNMRLSVAGTTAKLEINGQTHSTVTLTKPDMIFRKLIIGGVKPDVDRLFEVMVKTGSQPATDCADVVGGTAYIDTCGICVGGTTGKTPCATQVIWDADNDKRWSLPDIIYGLQVLTGFRK
jgi:hypothetical protein